jgi:ribosomal protein S27E
MDVTDPHRAWREAARFEVRRSVIWLLHHPELRRGELADDEELSAAWAVLDEALDRFDPDADEAMKIALPLRWQSHSSNDPLTKLLAAAPSHWTAEQHAQVVEKLERARDRFPYTLEREDIDAGIRNFEDLFAKPSQARLPAGPSTRYASLTMRSSCPTCGAAVAVNGPRRELECHACGEPVKVPYLAVAHLVRYFEDHYPTAEDRGEHSEDEHSWQWTYRNHAQPPCPECREPLTTLASGDEQTQCSRCGAEPLVEPAPAWLRRLASMATRVIMPGPVVPPASEAVTVACPGCGAPVPVPSTRRAALSCRHCDASVIVPNMVWQQLEPPSIAKPWTVELVGEPLPVTARRLWEAVEAERAASEPKPAPVERPAAEPLEITAPPSSEPRPAPLADSLAQAPPVAKGRSTGIGLVLVLAVVGLIAVVVVILALAP